MAKEQIYQTLKDLLELERIASDQRYDGLYLTGLNKRTRIEVREDYPRNSKFRRGDGVQLRTRIILHQEKVRGYRLRTVKTVSQKANGTFNFPLIIAAVQDLFKDQQDKLDAAQVTDNRRERNQQAICDLGDLHWPRGMRIVPSSYEEGQCRIEFEFGNKVAIEALPRVAAFVNGVFNSVEDKVIDVIATSRKTGHEIANEMIAKSGINDLNRYANTDFENTDKKLSSRQRAAKQQVEMTRLAQEYKDKSEGYKEHPEYD